MNRLPRLAYSGASLGVAGVVLTQAVIHGHWEATYFEAVQAALLSLPPVRLDWPFGWTPAFIWGTLLS